MYPSLFLFVEMKRKRTLHSWFASNSNASPIVPEPNTPPIDVVVQPAPVENLIHPTPTNESTNPSTNVDESTIPPTTNESIDHMMSTNQPPK